MGTPIESSVLEYGRDCTLCTPALWPTGKTPKFVYAYISEIIDCTVSPFKAPNGQTFKLEQSPVDVCLWLHPGDVWSLDFQPDRIIPDESMVRLYDKHGYFFFVGIGSTCPVELTLFANYYTSCFGLLAGYDGFCLLSWSKQLLDLVQWFGLEAGVNLMHEIFTHPDGDIVHKFCDIIQSTNIKLKLSP